MLKEWLILIGISVCGMLFWFMCYRNSAKARFSTAKNKEKQPKLTHVRIFYIITGIIGQIWFWYAMWLLKGFAEKNNKLRGTL